jgi:WD40 repeat protein
MLGGHAGTVTATFTADGTGIVTGDVNGRARMWDAETGAERGQVFEAGPGTRAWPSPDGRTVLVDDGRGPLALLDATTGRRRTTLPAGGDGWRDGASSWSRDGTRLAHARADSGHSTLWDLADPDHPRQVARLRPDGRPDTTVGWTEFSADGRRVAVARREAGPVTVFDTANGRRVSVVRTPNEAVGQISFSPDGRTLAVTARGTGRRGGDPTTSWRVDFFDVATGHRRAGLAVPPLTGSVAYGGGGSRLATISTSRGPTASDPGASSLGLWDAAGLQPVGDAASFPGAPFGTEPRVVATPDGRRLVHGVIDSAVVWDLEPSRWEDMACRIANRSLTRAEWERYLPGRAYDPAC